MGRLEDRVDAKLALTAGLEGQVCSWKRAKRDYWIVVCSGDAKLALTAGLEVQVGVYESAA